MVGQLNRAGLKGSLLQPLTSDELYEIHCSSLEVLEKIGVRVDEPEALALLDKAGCEVDMERGLVKIPQYLVREAIHKTPNTVTLCGRSKKNDLKFGTGEVHARISGGVPYIVDIESGEHREGLKTDVSETARVADALDNIDGIMSPLVVPADVPTANIELHAVEQAFNSTSKHVLTEIWSKERIDDVIEMARMVAGGEKELRKRPIISCLTQPVSPLQHGELQTKILVGFAKAGLPLNVRAHPITGLSCPITIAAELVMTNAENLSSIVIAELSNPGTPVIYGAASSTADMRSGLNLAGAVEIGLLGTGVAQLARFYGLPSTINSGIDSPIPDAQAAIDRIMTMLPPILAGIDDISICANESKSTFYYEQLIIDNEILSTIDRLLKGIEVSDDTLAVELINEVGPGGTFLSKRHTLEYYEREHLIPNIFSRVRRGDWEKAGAKVLRERARDKARRILKKHEPLPLESNVRRDLASFVKQASKGSR